MEKAKRDIYLERFRNPFVVTPGEFWANRNHLWKEIMDRIELAKLTKSNEIIVLIGDYGCGTTHALLCLQKDLREKGAIASYIPMPFDKELSSMYRRFVSDLQPDVKDKLLSKLIEDFVPRDMDRRIEALAERRRVTVSDIPRIFERYILGERLSMRERMILEDVGFEREIPPIIDLWSRSIWTLATDEWPVFILIDEFDIILTEPISSRDIFYRLRRLYDETLHGLCLVIALKGKPNEVRQILGKALESRMSLQPVYMYPISKPEAQEFLSELLQYRGYTTKESPFHPFTKDGIEALSQLVCPATPRHLLRVSSVIFEEARLKDVPIIDKEFVLSVTTRFGKLAILEIEKIKEKREPEIPIISPMPKRPELAGVIEFGTNGVPHIILSPEKLTAREVIGLLLYAKSPSPVSMGELKTLVASNWKSVDMPYISANINQMKGLIIKEGAKGAYTYRLSSSGKAWIENELLPKLRAQKNQM